MGTAWWAAYVSDELATDDAALHIQAELDRIVAQMSPWEEASDVSRFNRSPANSWVELPPELMCVLTAALQVAEESNGAYDPACGALVDLWGFGPAPKRSAPPAPEAIERARALGGRSLRIDGARAFQPGGARLDLSSIAKGYGVDAAGDALDRVGVREWLVEVGGELRGRGTKPDGSPWWVALEPRVDEPFLVALSGLSAATSGDTVRCFDHNGRKYSHTIDPRTGYPVSHALSAVTVLHEGAMLADAYATAILVLGPDEGLAFAEERGLAARLVMREAHSLRERTTSALSAMLD